MGEKKLQKVCFIILNILVIALMLSCGGGKGSPGDGTISCETDDDCSTDMRCVEGICKPRKCASDQDCASNERCNVPRGECVVITTCTPETMDKDGDGYVSPGCIDPVTGGYGNDCEDNNANVYPGAEEVCNETDDNCNGTADEGFDTRVFFVDRDDDGWGVIPNPSEFQFSWVVVRTCLSEEELEERQGMKYSPETGDCNDDDHNIHPEAEEVCNEIDDDCDGDVDENVQETFFADRDADNYPDINNIKEGCEPPAGYIPLREDGKWDCYDGDGRMNPDAQEVCDGLDNNCNGITDDVDEDMDGYYRCPGVAERDCNDTDPTIHPGATEVCNEADDNCNGLVDEQVQITFYRDVDGDNYGQDAARVTGCSPPEGYVDTGGDCNDYNPSIHPLAEEICNDVDDDCNGLVDDGLPQVEVYPDLDGDGYAISGLIPQNDCRVRLGWTTSQDPDGDGNPNWDCNDSDGTIHPAASEICDRKDNDCDGITDRWCGYICAGSWPVILPGDSAPDVAVGDMNQDGIMEIAAGNSGGFAIAEADGSILHFESGGVNYARRAGVFADIDGVWNGNNYTLELVAGPQSRIAFYKMDSSGSIIKRVNTYEVYDAGTFLARDVDGDGKVEIVIVTWGTIDRVRIFEYDSGSDLLELQSEIPFPDGTAVYTNGIAIADLDMDGSSELVFGEGYGLCDSPGWWSGRIFGFEFGGATQSIIYDTSITGLFGGDVGPLYVHDLDGDGANEVHAQVRYYRSNDPTICNPREGYKRWVWDGRNGSIESGPTSGDIQVFRDLDRDGSADADTFSIWRHDADGDGDLDEVSIDSSGRVVLKLRNGSTLVDMPPGSNIGSGTVVYLGDIDGNRKLNALISQSGKLQCVEFGDDTAHPWTGADGVPMYGEFVERTMQRDNWEPNETIQTAYFAKDDTNLYRGFIAHPGDVDVFRIGTPHCGQAIVKAPANVNLRVRLYGNVDRNGDTLPDVLDTKNLSAGSSQSLSCNATPNSRGLGRYWLEIASSDGSFSPWEPYTAQLDVNY